MKILFTSDWQLGAGAELGNGDHGPGSRFQDQVDVLDRIADLAVAEGCGLVGMLGDAFERARPAPQEILAVQAFVRKLTGAGVRCLFLRGNHDARGTALPSALEIFQGNGCVVALLPAIYPLDDVVIAALPWTPPGAIVAAMPDVARDDVNDAAAQALVAGARVLAERCSVEFPELRPILVGHWAVSGATLPTGLDTAMLREPVIPLEGLTELGFVLAAFGHIHQAQVVAPGPTPVFYCGSPCVMNWAESESEHGCWVYDSAAPALKFHQIADNRRFLTLDYTAELNHADVEGAVVRLRYTATEEEARRIDQRMIRDNLLDAGAAKVIFRPTIVREERARVAAMTDDLDETAALDLWLRSMEMEDVTAGLLRDVHGEFLQRVRA